MSDRPSSRVRRSTLSIALALTLAGSLLPLGTSAAAAGSASARRVRPPTPELIERAVRRGEITEARGALYLAWAFSAPDRVPEEYVGAVMGDLNSRRAKVQGMEPLARGVLIRALCPHAEAMTYDADLRSLTQGVGYFTMEPSHHDPVPPHIAQKIIEKRRAEGKVKGVEE